MEASHKTHRPHIKVGKDEEEEEAAPMCSIVNLRILLKSTRFFGQLVPPLLKHIFSSISWQLCIIIINISKIVSTHMFSWSQNVVL